MRHAINAGRGKETRWDTRFNPVNFFLNLVFKQELGPLSKLGHQPKAAPMPAKETACAC
jgi:hypothetical protein